MAVPLPSQILASITHEYWPYPGLAATRTCGDEWWLCYSQSRVLATREWILTTSESYTHMIWRDSENGTRWMGRTTKGSVGKRHGMVDGATMKDNERRADDGAVWHGKCMAEVQHVPSCRNPPQSNYLFWVSLMWRNRDANEEGLGGHTMGTGLIDMEPGWIGRKEKSLTTSKKGLQTAVRVVTGDTREGTSSRTVESISAPNHPNQGAPVKVFNWGRMVARA
ncbi:hypothetical protein GGX14DRAFT_390698 [Mycena pura]|uniref:Uncharacterized protein n=1 Tax=Mycena pura TaxID=153505 RepID=A0AAD6VRQ6_9AGAR|nr:hypothetical protein GGX14DRAFT_390698 [Mycena pura]